jgi:uncharacterized protein (TIGR03083 family)
MVPAVDEPELADLDPFELMATEAARIDRFYAGLSDADWRAPTRCAGWDRRDLLAHLATVEDYTRAGLRGEVQALFAQSAGSGLDSFNDWGIGWRATLSTVELLAQWRQLVAENDAELRERGPRGTLDTSVGDYPVGRQAFYLASERAIHADDAGVPISPEEADARRDWRLRFGRAALTESRHGGEVTVVSDRGAHFVRFGSDEARLTDDQFVEALSGRLPETVDVPAGLRQALAVLN